MTGPERAGEVGLTAAPDPAMTSGPECHGKTHFASKRMARRTARWRTYQDGGRWGWKDEQTIYLCGCGLWRVKRLEDTP